MIQTQRDTNNYGNKGWKDDSEMYLPCAGSPEFHPSLFESRVPNSSHTGYGMVFGSFSTYSISLKGRRLYTQACLVLLATKSTRRGVRMPYQSYERWCYSCYYDTSGHYSLGLILGLPLNKHHWRLKEETRELDENRRQWLRWLSQSVKIRT